SVRPFRLPVCAMTTVPRDNRADQGGKAVAAAALGADEVAAVTESLAQRGDLHLQVCLGDNDAGPYSTQQFVLSDQRSIGLQQDEKKIKGSRTQLDLRPVHEQLPLAS